MCLIGNTEWTERRVLTMLCDELDALRAECALHSETHRKLLTHIETEARARQPILPLVTELLGGSLPGPYRTNATDPPRSGPGQAETYGCPDNACDRICSTGPAEPQPRCKLTETPMRRR